MPEELLLLKNVIQDMAKVLRDVQQEIVKFVVLTFRELGQKPLVSIPLHMPQAWLLPRSPALSVNQPRQAAGFRAKATNT